MPMPGDQHRDTEATKNPFAPAIPRISEWTAQEIATLQSRLDRQLGPEYISTRPGAGGGKVHYLAAEKVINLANEVFGFNGWSSAIQNVQIDFVDENTQSGKITLGLSTIVRVTLRDGTYHEDIGYGHIENCKGKAAAFEKAKKEAATDALKRALRNFGNVLGNCLYDKDYLQKVTRLKVAPSRWDEENLHRHSDYAPIKREAAADSNSRQIEKHAENGNDNGNSNGSVPKRIPSLQSNGSAMFEDDFGTNMFDDNDFTNSDRIHLNDSVTIDSPAQGMPSKQQSMVRMSSLPNVRQPNTHTPAVQGAHSLQSPQKPNNLQDPSKAAAPMHTNRLLQPQNSGHQAPGPAGIGGASSSSDHLNGAAQGMNPISGNAQAKPAADTDASLTAAGNQDDEWNPPLPKEPPPDRPEGFITGRAVDLLDRPQELRPPHSSIAFNPHFESPGIRRTQGVNPGKSAPIKMSTINRQFAGNGNVDMSPAARGNNSPNSPAAHARGNFVNPSADPNRKIGMPPAIGLQSRTTYKPPTAVKRPALADMSNIPQSDPSSDAKRVKTGTPPPPPAPHVQQKAPDPAVNAT